jgi:hypothetical protein
MKTRSKSPSRSKIHNEHENSIQDSNKNKAFAIQHLHPPPAKQGGAHEKILPGINIGDPLFDQMVCLRLKKFSICIF